MAFTVKNQPFQFSGTGENSANLFEDITTRGLQNVRVGGSAGKIITGAANTVVGYESGRNMQDSQFTTCIGYQAGYNSLISTCNTMVGALAGANNNEGSELVFIGYRSGENSTYANKCVGVGANTLNECMSGQGVVAVGYRAGERSLDGSYNTMVGAESGQDNRSGNFNTMTGYRSGRSSFLGNENTYFGAFTGYSNTHGNANCFIGYKSGMGLVNGDLNIAIGAYTMQSTLFASCNVVIGPFAGSTQNTCERNVLIGTNVAGGAAGMTDSVIIGSAAASNMSGAGCVVIGANVATNCTYGMSNVLVGTGANTVLTSNTFGIAIGNSNTYTYNQSIAIGDNINNKRDTSVVIGYNLNTDARASVILGNDISISSMKAFKDPLFFPSCNVVLADGVRKFNVQSIQYDDTLRNPLPPKNIYPCAQFSVLSSNVVDSRTNPEPLRVGPSDFNLLNWVDSYLITQGSLIIITDALTTQTIQPFTLPNPMSSFNINNADWLYTHSSNIVIPTNANAVNVRAFNQSNTSVPLYFVKSCSTPIITSYTSNVTVTNLAPTLLPVNPTISNVATFLTSTSDIYISESPKYGSVSPPFTYTLYPDYLFATQDSFSCIPATTITDSAGNAYGLMSSNQIKPISISLQTGCNQFYQSNINFDITKTYMFTSSNFPKLSASSPILFTSIGQDAMLHVANAAYSSNNVATMIREGMSNYPVSAYPTYFQHIFNDVQSNVTLNADTIVQLNSNLTLFTSNVYHSTTLNSQDKLALSNAAYTTCNIYANSLSNLNTLVYSFAVLLDQTSNIEPSLTSNLIDWQSGFDTVQPYPMLQTSNLFALYPTKPQGTTLNNALNSLHTSYPQITPTYYAYSNLYRKYFQLPSTFITQDDLAHNRVYLTYSGSVASNVELNVNDTSYNLAAFGTTKSPVWSSCWSNTTYNKTVSQYTTPVFNYLDNLYISKPPTHGVLDKRNKSLKYQLYNPWFTYDTCAVVMTSNAYSADIKINVATNSNTILQPFTLLTRPSITTCLSNVSVLHFASSNFRPLSNISVVNGHATSNAINMYDPSIGWYKSTSNITTIVEPLISTQSGTGNMYVTSNINMVKYTYSNDILQSTVPESIILSEHSSIPDPLDTYITYSNAVIITHRDYFPVGTATSIYTASNTYINYYNNRNDTLIYSDVHTQNMTQTVTTSITEPTPNGVYNVSNMATSNSYYNINQSYVDIDKHFIFNAFSNVYTDLASVTNGQVVIQNVGPSNVFTQQQLMTNAVKMCAISSTSTPLMTIISEPSDHLPVPKNLTVDSITHKVNLATFFGSDFFGGDEANYKPYMIHIHAIDKGAIIYNDTMQSVIPYASRGNAYYVATDYYTQDTISYFYTNASGTIVPAKIFDITIDIDMTPNIQGQDFNTGLSQYNDHVLHMQSSYQNPEFRLANPSMYTSLPTVITSPTMTFTATSNETLYYDIYVDNTLVSSSNVYPITAYNHHAFTLPRDATASTITTKSIGDTQATLVTGRVFDDAKATNDSSNIKVIISKQPAYGCLWESGSNVTSLTTLYGLTDLQYVSYDPDVIRNDSCELKLVYGTAESPVYPITLKNYVSRFSTRSENVATNFTIYPPAQNAGMIEDGLQWLPASQPIQETVTWTLAGSQYSQKIQTYVASESIHFSSNAVSATIDQADSITMSELITPHDGAIYFVATNPSSGIIFNTVTNQVVVSFAAAELANVIYQHLGYQNTADTFTLGVSTHPYNYSDTQCVVSLTIRPMPIVTKNAKKYVFYTPPYNDLIGAFDTFGTQESSYTHVKSSSSNMNFTKSIYYNEPITFTLPTFQKGAVLAAELVPNNYSSPHVNPLADVPLYRDMFVHDVYAYVNRQVNSNIMLDYDLNNTQQITYNFGSNNPQVQQKELTVQFQVKIKDDIVGNYRFYVQLGTTRIEFTETSPITLNAWNLIKIVNYENGSPHMVVYVGGTVSTTLDADPNIETVQIGVPVTDPSNYTQNAVYTLVDTDMSYELINYHNVIYVQEFQLLVSAYSQSQTDEADVHNVVTGKEIEVTGINNICIGNQFKTSGQNSIIIGNSIGTNGVSVASSVNDIYQCIVIGNNSYSNSIIRDVISIGNNILQDLSTVTDNTRLQEFLSRKPIIIGNDIDSSKIDFHVNVANTLLRTEADDTRQIYLGLDNEVVGIGYTSNVSLSSQYDLVVARGVRAGTVESVATFSAHSPTDIPVYRCVSSTGTVSSDMLCVAASSTPADPAICGVCIQSDGTSGNYTITVATGGCTQVMCDSPVNVGDLLVTSTTTGCARSATPSEYHLAFAKALTPGTSNMSLVRILLRV